MRTRRTLLLVGAISIGVLSGFAFAGSKSDPVNHDRSGVAIQGYDPVGYFTDSKPIKGVAHFAYSWNGANWHFASAEHRDLFAKNPDRYAPQFGGYCTYGVSKNHTVDIDPEAWRIIEGKLYLNYSKSVQREFLKDPEGHIQRAEQNWPNLHN